MRRRKRDNIGTQIWPFEIAYELPGLPGVPFTVPVKGWVDWYRISKGQGLKIVRQ